MRIIFFGIPDLGLLCLNALIENKKDIAAIVLPKVNQLACRSMSEISKINGIPVLMFENSLTEPEFIEAFKDYRPDIAFVCAYDNKIPEELLKIPPLGFVNCHPSLLPQYRGGNPYFHVLANDEKKAGVTFHYMDNGFDTGDIITQRELDILPGETFGTLYSRLNNLSVKMVVEVAEMFESGCEIPRIPQNLTEKYNKAPAVNPDKGHIYIDWKKDAGYIERFIRACNPMYGALTYYKNCGFKIWTAEAIKERRQYEPGTIVKVSNDYLYIATGNGLIMPKVVQIGLFLITDAKDFIKRSNPRVGEKFVS